MVCCFVFFFCRYSGSSHGGPSNSNTQKHHKQRLVNINNSSTNSTCSNDPGSQASINEETIGNSTSSVPGSALPTIQSTPSNVITNSCFIAGNSSNNLNGNSNLNNNGNNSTAVNLNLKVCKQLFSTTTTTTTIDNDGFCLFFAQFRIRRIEIEKMMSMKIRTIRDTTVVMSTMVKSMIWHPKNGRNAINYLSKQCPIVVSSSNKLSKMVRACFDRFRFKFMATKICMKSYDSKRWTIS